MLPPPDFLALKATWRKIWQLGFVIFSKRCTGKKLLGPVSPFGFSID